MATTSFIALIIQGNINAGGGSVPLVSVGVFPQAERDKIDSAPTIWEKISYKIKHCQTCIIYTMTDTAVRSIGASRDGQLTIALAIPRTLQLKDKSPYELLTAIYTKFVNENMKPTGDGYHQFDKSDIDREPYMELLSKNPTEPTEGRSSKIYIPMSQTGGIGVVQAATDEKLKALFRDSQYPEFRQFSEIEIGRTCQPTVNIEIPRHREYKIMLNGSLIKKTLVNGTDSFNSEDYLHDGAYTTYIGQHVAFTLSELITDEDGSMFDGRVTLQGDTVKCLVNSKPKEFKFQAVVKPSPGNTLTEEDKDNIEQWLDNNNLCVMFGDNNINQTFFNDETIQANGENVNLPLSISTSQSIENYQFSIEKNIESKKIILLVRKVRKQDPVPVRYPEPSPRKTQEQNNLPQPAATSTGMELWFINTKYFKNEYRAIVKSSDDKHYLRQTLSFIEKKQKNGGTLYRASLTLDDNWKQAYGIIVRIECNKDGIIFSSQPQSPSFLNNMAEIDITNLKYEEKPTKKPSMIIPIATGIAGAIVGLLMGFFLFSNSSKEENGDALRQLAELKAKVNSLENEIEKKEGDIARLNAQLNAPREEVKSESKKEESEKPEIAPQPVAKETLQVDYKSQIVDKFNTRNYDALSGNNGLLAKAVKAKQITGTQSQKISLFWWNPNDSKGKYNVSQKAKIRDALAGKQFRSIDNIVALSDQLASKLK